MKSTKNKLHTAILASLLATSVTACGGGGSGSSDPTPEIKTVTANLEINSNTYRNNLFCYNPDTAKEDICNIRMFQVMVEAFQNGDDSINYGTGWGPSNHKGDLQGVIDSLDYIKDLGMNAIWLTPVFQSAEIGPGATKLDATGYFGEDYYKVDPHFGNTDKLKELVDAAHAKGIYVFLDGVFGHFKSTINTLSPTNKQIVTTDTCRNMGGTYTAGDGTKCSDFGDDSTLDFYKELAAHYITKYKIDGWRLDQAYQLDSKQWKQVRDAIEAESAKKSNTYVLNGKKVLPLGYTVAEIWTENPQEIEKNVFANDGVSSAFNFPLRSQLVRVLATREDPFTPGSCQAPAKSLNDDILKKMNGYSRQSIMNNFLTNHDTVRFGDLLQRAKITVDGQNNRDYYDAHLTAMSFNAAMSGPLTVYYGDETGDDVKGFSQSPKNCIMLHQCDDHVSRSDGHVNNLTDAEEKLKENVSAVLNLRDTHPALAHGKRVHLYSDHSLYADFKQYEADKVIYVMNSGTGDRKITINNDVWGKLGLSSKCTMKSLFGGSVKDNVITAPALSGTFVNVTCK